MAEGSIGTAAGTSRAVGRSPYFDLPASPEQLEAVGRIAAAWSYLESVLEAAIWSLCVLEESRGRALTTHMNLKMRIESLQTLLHVLGDDESARELSRRRKRIEKLGQKRNEIVHGLWVRGEYGSPMILSVRARGTLEQRKAGRPASAMFTLADTIAETAFDLREMLVDRAVFR